MQLKGEILEKIPNGEIFAKLTGLFYGTYTR